MSNSKTTFLLASLNMASMTFRQKEIKTKHSAWNHFILSSNSLRILFLFFSLSLSQSFHSLTLPLSYFFYSSISTPPSFSISFSFSFHLHFSISTTINLLFSYLSLNSSPLLSLSLSPPLSLLSDLIHRSTFILFSYFPYLIKSLHILRSRSMSLFIYFIIFISIYNQKLSCD